MDIWEKKDKECEKVPVSGKIFNFPKGEVKLKYVNYWQSNPRLEGKAEDYEDSEDKGTINEQILDLMFQPDNIREYKNDVYRPTKLEINNNNRSRSAKLRFAIRSNNKFEYPMDLIEKFNKYISLESTNV